ncbi:hypothetical protein K8I31_14005, partial [bacterium]|nr:hypothetical protein [bacterium]
MRFLFSLLFSFILAISSITHAQTVEFQTYVTAGEVEPLFSAPEQCQKSIAALKALNIKTVYLETIRGTQAPSLDVLAAARDALQAEGFRVSAGIATIFGDGFGVDSNRPGIWLNYQAEETQHNLADHISKIAPLFD